MAVSTSGLVYRRRRFLEVAAPSSGTPAVYERTLQFVCWGGVPYYSYSIIYPKTLLGSQEPRAFQVLTLQPQGPTKGACVIGILQEELKG